MKPISDELLEELVKLAATAMTVLPDVTTNSNVVFKNSVIRSREKYRRLSFELAGDLAKELLEFHALAKIIQSGNVSAETIREQDRKTTKEIYGREI
jgi:hypothetical protein